MHRKFADAEAAGAGLLQWTLPMSECPLLKKFGICVMGYSKVRRGYKMLRTKPTFSNINVTLSGKGKVLIGGRWKTVQSGMAVLSPAKAAHGSYSFTRTPWEFYYICFHDEWGSHAKIRVPEPTIVYVDPKPIHWAIEGLHREFEHTQQKPILDGLLGVIDLYAQRMTAPWHVENHLWKLWERVEQVPGENWTIDSLARCARVSSRNLQRLCQKEFGRSVYQQLTHIRFTKAGLLLKNRALKVQTIAEAVGYPEAFTFSKAFKKWSGASPSDYRLRWSAVE